VTATRWDLSPLEAAGDGEEALARVLELCRSFHGRYAGRLASLDAATLRSLLDELGRLWDDLSSSSAYALLRSAENVLDEEAQEIAAKAELALAEADELLRFVEVEWLTVPDDRAKRLLEDPRLAPYRHLLHAKRRLRPYVLSAEAEQALASRDAAAEEAWVAHYDRTLASLRTTFDGRETTLGELLAQSRHPDRDVRAAALVSLQALLEPVLPTLAHCYDTLVADRIAVDELRGFDGPRASSDLENELPPRLVDAMLDAVERHFELGCQWLREKERLLGIRLSVADEHAPLDADRPVPFEEATTTIVETLDGLAPRLGRLARSLLAEGRIDAEPRAGKVGTGFCMTVSRREQPFILLNYRERLSDALRLAHEIGHATQFVLAAEAGTPLTLQPPLGLGEVAAFFTQLLVADALVDAEPDPDVRRAFAAVRLEASLDVFRQVVLTRFEEKAYRLRAAGQPLSPARLSTLWLEASRRYYGACVDVPDAFGVSWAFVGHLVRARFYNCAYVFASLTSLLLRRLVAEQDDFGERYLTFLSRGGSADPLDQLAELGIDPRRDDVWETAFSELRSLLALVERPLSPVS
jgi:oligoendopeptidase F